MTKAELESKHLAELHALAAEAGVPRYRMLRREELVEALADGGEKPKAKPRRERRPRQRRERPEPRERPRATRERPRVEEPAPVEREEATAPAAPSAPAEPSRPRRRRRRRFGRKRRELSLKDLLSGAPGRQAIVYAESRQACTALLRELAAELGGGSGGPDPIALLVDPGPEELADWRREAPEAEIVAAAQARHAEDALAQAAKRAAAGEEVIVLVDSLSRFGDADAASALLDAAGSVTVVAALERG